MSARVNRRLVATVGAAVLAAGAAVGIAEATNGSRGEPDHDVGRAGYTVGLFGDVPYGATGRAQYPALLADMNAAKLAFSIYDGDLKSGGDGACTDTLYTTALANFNSLERPVVFLPGDNDWTDCWGLYGPGTGGYDPLERLAFERRLFWSTDQSLGQRTMALTRQTGVPENVRWQRGPVVFVGLNVQGSNDNFPYAGVAGETRPQADIDRMRAESTARKAANLAWLHESFAEAKRVGAKGVLISWQADPNFNNERQYTDPRLWDAYPAYVDALRSETMAFDGQVALVHGDAHYFKMDKPINRPNGAVLANFTRVETFGARNTHWVSATIDPRDPNLFQFAPRIVPANANG